jgi:8-amino-7-oxononanoate synthase
LAITPSNPNLPTSPLPRRSQHTVLQTGLEPGPEPRSEPGSQIGPQTGPRPWPFASAALAEQAANHRQRQLRSLTPIDALQVQRGQQILLNFSANDYLGLAKHPAVIARAVDYTQRYGASATASRLVAGAFVIHQQLEGQLAAALGYEAALLFGTGFQANATVIPALVGKDAKETLILCDRLIHNSLITGILASGARFIRFPHNNMAALERQLHKTEGHYRRRLIISETVFSMDGDRADLDRLIALAEKFAAFLYLDDAHALGVLGPAGMGLAARRPGVDLLVGTFGKSCGAAGAFVACSEQLRDYLINFCPGVIYTTALPPGSIGAVAAALELIPTLEAERSQLATEAEWLRRQLEGLGYGTGGSQSQIVPAIVGPEAEALALAAHLETQGYLATAIRPPTVPAHTARIRFALSCHHRREHLAGLVAAIAGFRQGRMGTSTS